VTNKPYQYSWKMITAQAAGLGALTLVGGGLATDWLFAVKMTAVVVLGIFAFGAYMRRKSPQP